MLDAATFAVMGLLLVFAAGPVSVLMRISAPLLFYAGLLLMPVACFMALLARASQAPAWTIKLIVLGNLSGSSPVLSTQNRALTSNALGWISILAQSAVVAIFALLECSIHTSVVPVC